MDNCGIRKSITSNNDNILINSIKTGDTHNLNSLGSDVDNKVKSNNSQLLSVDGWENYQKELIQVCFEFWEVNETQVKVNNSLQSDSTNELQTPSSLFANNCHRNIIEFKSKPTTDNIIISDKVQNKVCIEINDKFLKSKYENNPDIQGSSKAINNNIDGEKNKNSIKIVDNRVNKRTKKKLKTFSFYKNTSNQVKSSKKVQPLTFDTSCSLEDLWKYKKWLDSVDKVKKYTSDININDENIKENNYSDKAYCDKTNNCNTYSLDFEAKEMEQKFRKLIKSLNEKDKLFSRVGINEQSTKFGSSNKFKYFLKNAFRGTHNELDTHILDDYTKFINHKLHTWQSLLNCLEDIRQRKSSKIKMYNPLEDTIKYRFSEINFHDLKTMDDYDYNNSKFFEINDNFSEMEKQKKNKFFKLLNKKKSTMDMGTLVKQTTEQNSTDNIRVNNYQCISNQIIDNKILKMDTAILDVEKNRKSSGEIKKSLSDTDLLVLTSDYDKKLNKIGNKITRISGEKLNSIEMSMTNEEYNRHWDSMTKESWEERQETFQTAVARLEYVGCTFKEQCRLNGLKTLCKVDVLASFGYSAEAVDLFVSTLPLSKNPDLMIRKAEAAYDWKFFCHLSMWRHSYKD
ncbi:uncharacterized protein PF11_0213-like [Melanaphis sacchari]|uniref:uncharacterized protein PF11_0213-like n=1 Tax=Melanaphis sacchari TaxID=742174 RepID=UPI000DC151AB|nr:uncharacterized protein PF11_0213-like [Melanaphis sacchari]